MTWIVILGQPGRDALTMVGPWPDTFYADRHRRPDRPAMVDCLMTTEEEP